MKQTILTVDDSSVNRLLIESILKNQYNVLNAKNGEEMWQILIASRPDLILMDVMMPKVDGYELTQALHHHPKYSDIPVIFLTARDSSQDLKRGFDCGGMDYIKKPFNEIELRARIKSVLRIKELEHQLTLKAIIDPLTDIFNRRHFFDISSKELARTLRNRKREKKLSLAILDIDSFKVVNDTYGHQAGDFILVELAKLLKFGIRQYDILARYGGEEFIILFCDCDKAEALDVLQRLKDQFDGQTYSSGSQDIHCSFSCGLVELDECRDEIVTIDGLIKMADTRLYLAKEAGRNCIIDHF
jgi:diguanylate cyclase (GGDEF)-like protein